MFNPNANGVGAHAVGVAVKRSSASERFAARARDAVGWFRRHNVADRIVRPTACSFWEQSATICSESGGYCEGAVHAVFVKSIAPVRTAE